jgi:hypothetical protein
MEVQQFLRCKNKHCGKPIPLLRSNHLRSYEVPTMSATDSQPNNFACPSCDHAFAYTGLEVRSDPAAPDQSSELIYGLIEFDCEAENCGTRVLIHKPILPTSDDLPKLEIEAKHWTLYCQCVHGHEITTLPNSYWSSAYESSGWSRLEKEGMD